MVHAAWTCIQPTARLATGFLLSTRRPAVGPGSGAVSHLGDGTGLTCVVDLSQRPPGLGLGLRGRGRARARARASRVGVRLGVRVGCGAAT